MLGEPHEIQSEPVEHYHLVHDRGVQAWHVHARFRRVAEIVDGADAKGWTHDVLRWSGGLARARLPGPIARPSFIVMSSVARGYEAPGRLNRCWRVPGGCHGWRLPDALAACHDGVCK